MYNWRLWPFVLLRSAGFPFDGLERLRLHAASEAADALIAADAICEKAHGDALGALSAIRFELLSDDDRTVVLAVARSIRADKPIDEALLASISRIAPAAASAVAGWRTATQAHGAAASQFDQDYDRELRTIRSALRQIVSDEALQEAVLWQSRDALTGLQSLARDDVSVRNSKTRQREQLAVMYLQRYLAKNDTIGYFGPIALGTLGKHSQALTFVHGTELTSKSQVYFEHWAIAAIAARVSEDERLKPFLRPTLHPKMRLSEDTLLYPIGKSIVLDEEQRRLIEACDGQRTLADVVEYLIRRQVFATVDDVRSAIDELLEQSVLHASVSIATGFVRPEETLRRQLARLPSEPRARWERVLDELVVLLSELDRARGLAKRQAAMDALEARFGEVTEVSSRRGAGQMYRGRMVAYLDCTRDVAELDVGRSFMERVTPVLELIGLSARWYTHEIARRIERHCRERFANLAVEQADFLTWWSDVEKTLPASCFRDVLGEMQQAWARVLGIDGKETRSVERRCADVREAVQAEFSAAAPGWPRARFHSPDLMIAARDVDAINRGEYLIVLGEIHVAFNSVCYPMFIKLFDEASAIEELFARDAGPLIEPVVSATQMHRALNFIIDYPDLIEIETDETPSRLPRERVVRMADLRVEIDVEGALVVTDVPSGRRFPLLAVLDAYLTFNTLNFSIVGKDAACSPRITLDGVVLSRRKWVVESFPDFSDDSFLRTRRFARQLDLPTWFFAKFEHEPKPMLVDLDNPLLVEAFAKISRRGGTAQLSEMLPAAEDLWLRDAAGRRYTSELRMTIVDGHPLPE